MTPKVLIPLTLCAAIGSALSAPAGAAGPPSPVLLVPDPAQVMLQTQLGIQQAQAEARRAATQAQVQAELNANQARLEGQLAARQASSEGRLAAPSVSAAMATAAELAGLSLATTPPTRGPFENANGEMKLLTLTPQLGRYFGTDHGVLVARAPTHGVLRLQDGDVILSIGDRTPASSSQAMRILTSYDPGEQINLVILRDHHRVHLTATLPAAPAGP